MDDEQKPDTLIERLKKYAELRAAQKASEDEASGLKAEADLMERDLVDYFIENDMQNTKVAGKTIFLHPSTFAQRKPGVTTEDVKAALIKSGLAHLVTDTVNANTLSAYVRQQDDADEPLPAPLAEVVELGSRLSLRIR